MAKELCLTIPCETGHAAEFEPIHTFIGNDSTGAARTQWKCPHCGRMFERRKPCTKHMGMIMNIPAGCPVLNAQDEKRRKSIEEWLKETWQPGPTHESTILSDELWQLRERAKLNAQDRDNF